MSCKATHTVATYIAGTLTRPLPPEVEEKATLHLLDTVAAIVSGTQLAAGRAGTRLAARLGGPEEALAINIDQPLDAIVTAAAEGLAS